MNLTILVTYSIFFADLVLKDKIFVYDLAHQRIGWSYYDCKFKFTIQLYAFYRKLRFSFSKYLLHRLGLPTLLGSLSVNVSITSSKDFINEGQLSVSSSTKEMLFKLIPLSFVTFLILLLELVEFQFL